MPWQTDPTPYRVWVSEIMLQQTQVATVVPYYERFMKRFPDVKVLADASRDEVLTCWSGLGYYSRAHNLHKAAHVISMEHAGVFPNKLEEVMALPGIGRSTAGAILALSLNQRHSILDGNCKRVLARYHAVDGWPGETVVVKKLWSHADVHTPDDKVADYTQAIMDLGATVCTRTRPRCEICPLTKNCAARKAGTPGKFPGHRPKKIQPVKETRMIIVYSPEGTVLLERRPPAGIWGGLWSLPECAMDEDPALICAERFGLESEPTDTLPGFRHTFSHYHLDIAPLTLTVTGNSTDIMERPDVLWAGKPDLEDMGLPAPVRRLLGDFLRSDGSPCQERLTA
jgi:A/G-specific adenine glycosylase